MSLVDLLGGGAALLVGWHVGGGRPPVGGGHYHVTLSRRSGLCWQHGYVRIVW